MNIGINKVILIGNVGASAELRHTEAGVPVTNFNLATNYQARGEDQVEWHKIVVWNALAELCAKYLEKGLRVYVEGHLHTKKYEDRDGNYQYVTEIVAHQVTFLGSTRRVEETTTQEVIQEEEEQLNSVF